MLDEYELMKTTVRSSISHTGEERDGTCVIGAPGCTWAINFDGGYHYSLWSLSKGLGSYIPANLSDPANWYAKVVDLLLSEQNADGSWPVDGRDDATPIVATGFALVAAFVNAAVGLCLGCEAYLLIQRIRTPSTATTT